MASNSSRFRDLRRELNLLKRQFIPSINPTGQYSPLKLARVVAYKVLAHAEIEFYFEERVKDVALEAKRQWDNTSSNNRTLLCLLAFSVQMMEEPPMT